MSSRIACCTAVGLLLATAFAATQAPEVTFRTEGNFVKGLTREDFRLSEDGKPQKINTRPLFTERDPLPIESDVSSNAQVLDVPSRYPGSFSSGWFSNAMETWIGGADDGGGSLSHDGIEGG